MEGKDGKGWKERMENNGRKGWKIMEGKDGKGWKERMENDGRKG